MGRMTLRIGVVDDDDRFRAIARRTLAADGVDVVGEARSGEEAMGAFARWGADVVLLDLQLPGIDGLEVARRVHADGHGPALILISTCDAAYGQRAATGVAAGFLPKEALSLSAIVEILGPDPMIV
jgi:DNA-binding NarL/FixJ family response regulator